MLTESQLREISGNLARRPGHEAVRAEVYRLLVDHLGASPRDLDFERTLPEVHGRVDAILGRTVFEFKSDLRKEQDEAERQLASYLPDRERETGASHIGIATDGADFIPYEVRRGNLIRRTAFRVKRGDSHGLPLWLSPFLASRPELTPDPQTIRTELGRESLVYEVAGSRLAEFWETAHRLPEVQLKRRLWADRLQTVYGARVDDDALFFQHTYLTIVAKTMATLVLGAEVPDPHDLLSGKPFRDFGIEGVIESDFFDWVLQVEASDDLIRRIAAQVARFRLSDIRHDVLKVLYESLIDPEQRHFLGEYYTPDWLAEWICAAAISNPLEQRVIDPSCGSGTFLFHAVRRFLAAAARSGMKSRDAVKRCTELVMGIDVHPVAVINARITYLLAIGETLLRDRPPISVPVYLGDSMQWGAGTLIAGSGISISVPDGRETLEFPREVAEHPALMDAVIAEMIRMSEEGANESSFSAWLAQHEAAQKLSDNSRRGLAKTYSALTALHASHRNHIWGYIARNLSRPVWLSTPEQKAQVVVGNPPWLSFRHFSNEQRQRFREGCERRGMWAGGKVATHQDLSAYFFVRCMELYLAAKGTIAMVMPFATMSRQQYRGFIWQLHRGERGETWAPARKFTAAWILDGVAPLFNVPSGVLFAEQSETAAEVPREATAFTGHLTERDASGSAAKRALKRQMVAWPQPEGGHATTSPYEGRFRQGATVVPRKFFLVARTPAGRFGSNPDRPLVESRTSSLEKQPWKDLPPLKGAVERKFLRPLYLGESIAPFRLLEPAEAIIPWTRDNGLLDSDRARSLGYRDLAAWLNGAEDLWNAHNRGRLSLLARLDFQHELESQFPIPRLRVLYAASGTLPAAATIADPQGVIEHALYWAAVVSQREARYLTALLNSEGLRHRVEERQARGQWGARHFDKLLAQAIPEFDATNAIHAELAGYAARAERVAAGVELPEHVHFIRARKIIRQALASDGVAGKIEELVRGILR